MELREGDNMDYTACWFITVLVFFVLEAITVGIVSFWFGIGALAAGISSLFIDNLTVGLIIFVVVSGLTLVFLRPYLKRHFPERKLLNTLVGEVGYLETDITERELGKMTIGDVTWMVSSKSGKEIKKDTKVKVVEIEGNKLIVEEVGI